MGIISKLICEHRLPIPSEKFDEEEKEFFGEIKWDELEFFTSSFMYGSEFLEVHTYTISEDGQFYKESQEDGVERQDFTGEIYFGTQILGENNDYEVSFIVLFYKGELKELELDVWAKADNKERKERQEQLRAALHEQLNKKRGAIYFAKWTFVKIIDFCGRALVWKLNILSKIKGWLER